MKKFKIVTFNLQSWNISEERKEAVVSKLKSLSADLIGLQEVTPFWNKVVFENFSDEYYIIGDYRLESLEKDPWNEKSPILVKKSLFNVINNKTFWLSSTPEKESIAPECFYPRICTFAQLEIKENNKQFLFANTHLDHKGNVGRENECKYLIEFIKEKLNMPMLLSGDFNSESTDNSYIWITKFLKDSKFCFEPVDLTWTWHSYEKPVEQIIDYIFINDYIAPISYTVDTDLYKEKDISDHHPVILEFEFKN